MEDEKDRTSGKWLDDSRAWWMIGLIVICILLGASATLRWWPSLATSETSSGPVPDQLLSSTLPPKVTSPVSAVAVSSPWPNALRSEV